MINIEIIIYIADRGKKRCRIRTPEGDKEDFAKMPRRFQLTNVETQWKYWDGAGHPI